MQLDQEIRFELAQLKHLAEAAERLMAVKAEDRRPWDAAAAAKYVSDLHAGFENLCKRRMASMGVSFPEGRNSHARILADFLALPDLGGKLNDDQSLLLKKYLRFRHRFIHGYGIDVDWEMVAEPLRRIPEMVSLLTSLWTAWLSNRPAD